MYIIATEDAISVNLVKEHDREQHPMGLMYYMCLTTPRPFGPRCTGPTCMMTWMI